MENSIQLFNSEVFGEVRAMEIESKVWFVARDVVEDLGYEVGTKSYTHYISKFVKDKYQLKMNNTELVLLGMNNPGRKGEILINQYGVIALVMNSKLPQADEFQDWVIEDVIPSILETGTYSINEPQLPEITHEKSLVLKVFDNRANPVEFALAIGEFGDFKYNEGAMFICDENTINLTRVAEMIEHTLNDKLQELKYSYNYATLGTEFTRFLTFNKHFDLKLFKRKDDKGVEKVRHKQPTQLFYDMFVSQGMAIAKAVGDDRGKIDVIFTNNVYKYILTDEFKEGFMSYLYKTNPFLVDVMNSSIE